MFVTSMCRNRILLEKSTRGSRFWLKFGISPGGRKYKLMAGGDIGVMSDVKMEYYPSDCGLGASLNYTQGCTRRLSTNINIIPRNIPTITRVIFPLVRVRLDACVSREFLSQHTRFLILQCCRSKRLVNGRLRCDQQRSTCSWLLNSGKDTQ